MTVRARSPWRKDAQFSIYVSRRELARIDAAAASAGISRSTWLRHVAMRAAGHAPELPASLPPLPPGGPSARLTRKVVTTYLTDEQYAVLDEHARACQVTLAEFLRQKLLGAFPRERRSPLRSAIVAVNRARRQLQELAEPARAGAPVSPALDSAVAGLFDAIQAVREALLAADATDPREPGG